ncbi:MAG: UDP-N-acetylmuramoylalanine--D-glutamate ligase [Desulfuromonadales bacterium GWD2_61_12]|nr:MAG: UDP-N-acetylmuramoylalanine--D-glutamate ligase [Desulfuromonadales bacterium GWC2_61_20]OGR32787.1 MAG: UDP-N-acetylmuramoylalanine--D-glutamate ligase [Desulfuromonadales bacterium GWD2_61_12]HBT81911.1 UDP-N-acetylmuramoyl-L-alanine--D-glutamate ligase [Desulfuromonas sp.]
MKRSYRDMQVVVVGAGGTGLALCTYFCQRGARVLLSDRRQAAAIAGLAPLVAAGVELDLGGHATARFVAADLVVISPGVPLDVPALIAAAAAGVPVLGEIEIAARDCTAPLVAITGTNGKSTTTTVMGEIFAAWGKTTFVGGNLGTPLIEATKRDDWDWIVAEISSFQLEAIDQFHPRYGLLLNLTEDHLDRYPDMAAYVAAKLRIFERMTADDVAILNAEDPLVLSATAAIAPRRVYFSSRRLLPEGIGFDGTALVWRHAGREVRFAAAELQLRGTHNLENVMAALLPPLLAGCPAALAWQTACAFAGLEHRMRVVRVLDGVTWYNDSKGTNVGSVVKSLAGLNRPVTLIAGGKDKGGDYLPLAPLIKEKVTTLVLIGQATDRIAAALGHLTTTRRAASLEEAVQLAREVTPAGGSVLLSPGCSSFDMFSGYVERGEVFTRAVLALPARGEEGR